MLKAAFEDQGFPVFRDTFPVPYMIWVADCEPASDGAERLNMIDACGSRLSWSLMEGCSEGRGNPTLITTSEFGA